jgi:histidinol dehydrogenase/sulfopropanediol 3-dehydrogenase
MEVLKSAQAATTAGKDVAGTVARIVAGVRDGGDTALLRYSRELDGAALQEVRVSSEAMRAARNHVDSSTLDALKFAAAQIRGFAERQKECLHPLSAETLPGVTLGHRLLPVSSVGCYVPAGRYPLPSTALMSVIPAKVAGVTRIAACSPPSHEGGSIHPAVLAALEIAGATEVYAMGGAQAVAAYAYGTASVAPVDMIVGPGNVYVTEAKRQVSGDVGIDMLAGPSEVLIIADDSASDEDVSMDLLAKCEHDPNSVSILVTTDRALAERVLARIEADAATLATAELAAATWAAHGEVILAESLTEAAALANQRAPEHLQVLTRDDDRVAAELSAYGSLFIGPNAPVAFGDYVSGPNHTLPTVRSARFSSGVWVGTFLRVLSWQRIDRQGAATLGPVCARLAGVEGLDAHRRSAELRL